MNTDQNMYDGYIKTISGRKFYLDRDVPGQTDICDITYALANVCRFSGHVKRFYSVAEHSILVYRLLLSWGVTSSKTLMTGLLHDATEAYLPDLPTPFKALMPEFQAREEFLWKNIAKHFKLWAKPEDVPDIDFKEVLLQQVAEEATGRSLIKHADRTALFIEAKILQPCGDVELWPEYELYSPLADAWIAASVVPLPADTTGVRVQDMNAIMLQVFNNLNYARLSDGSYQEKPMYGSSDAPRGTRPPQLAPQDIDNGDSIPRKHAVAEDEATPSQKSYLELSKSLAREGYDKGFIPEADAHWPPEINSDKLGVFVEDIDDTNPKDLIGITKPNMFLVPQSAQIYMALAMQDGAIKYGPYNWREKKVRASIYVSAALRHIGAWVDGEELATDSKKPHLGHALACLGILADAIETGNLVDDRPKPGAAPELIAHWTVDKKS